ncbi:MAG: GntR family transcriptional regulator [Planctomycetaceae bacterium]|nr:GntR family transcriptional regulator [Planctomycetaceae bacterium]
MAPSTELLTEFQNAQPVQEVLTGSSLDGEGTLTGQVYRLLRSLIVTLRLLPNQFLSEKDVAAGMDVSKTPVREAFIRLAEDGIVRIVPKSGTYVAPIDPDRAREGLFIWTSLESSCAWQAAQTSGMDDASRLRTLLAKGERCIADGDRDGYFAVNDDFHAALFDMADLPDAKKLIDAARFEVDRVINLHRHFPPDLQVFHSDHADLVNAVVRHDAEGARAAMLRHMGRFEDLLDRLSPDAELWELFTFLNRKRPGTRKSKIAQTT